MSVMSGAKAVRWQGRRAADRDDEAGAEEGEGVAEAEQARQAGRGGRVKKSNITDNESAKMKTGKG